MFIFYLYFIYILFYQSLDQTERERQERIARENKTPTPKEEITNADDPPYKKKDNDYPLEYNDDGMTIKSKKNGITLNEYGNQPYDTTQARDEILDDMLVT